MDQQAWALQLAQQQFAASPNPVMLQGQFPANLQPFPNNVGFRPNPMVASGHMPGNPISQAMAANPQAPTSAQMAVQMPGGSPGQFPGNINLNIMADKADPTANIPPQMLAQFGGDPNGAPRDQAQLMNALQQMNQADMASFLQSQGASLPSAPQGMLQAGAQQAPMTSAQQAMLPAGAQQGPHQSMLPTVQAPQGPPHGMMPAGGGQPPPQGMMPPGAQQGAMLPPRMSTQPPPNGMQINPAMLQAAEKQAQEEAQAATAAWLARQLADITGLHPGQGGAAGSGPGGNLSAQQQLEMLRAQQQQRMQQEMEQAGQTQLQDTKKDEDGEKLVPKQEKELAKSAKALQKQQAKEAKQLAKQKAKEEKRRLKKLARAEKDKDGHKDKDKAPGNPDKPRKSKGSPTIKPSKSKQHSPPAPSNPPQLAPSMPLQPPGGALPDVDHGGGPHQQMAMGNPQQVEAQRSQQHRAQQQQQQQAHSQLFPSLPPFLAQAPTNSDASVPFPPQQGGATGGPDSEGDYIQRMGTHLQMQLVQQMQQATQQAQAQPNSQDEEVLWQAQRQLAGQLEQVKQLMHVFYQQNQSSTAGVQRVPVSHPPAGPPGSLPDATNPQHLQLMQLQAMQQQQQQQQQPQQLQGPTHPAGPPLGMAEGNGAAPPAMTPSPAQMLMRQQRQQAPPQGEVGPGMGQPQQMSAMLHMQGGQGGEGAGPMPPHILQLLQQQQQQQQQAAAQQGEKSGPSAAEALMQVPGGGSGPGPGAMAVDFQMQQQQQQQSLLLMQALQHGQLSPEQVQQLQAQGVLPPAAPAGQWQGQAVEAQEGKGEAPVKEKKKREAVDGEGKEERKKSKLDNGKRASKGGEGE